MTQTPTWIPAWVPAQLRAAEARFPELRGHLRRLLRYGVTGGTAAVVDVGLFAVLTHTALPVAAAAVLSFLIAAVVNYRLTSRFVFDSTPHMRRLVRFVAVATIGLGVNVSVTLLAIGVLGVPPVPGKVVGIGVAFVINFLLTSVLVFDAMTFARPKR